MIQDMLKSTLCRDAVVRSIMLSVAILFFCVAAMAAATGAITTDFNDTALSAGDYIWFSSSTQVIGVGNRSATIYARNASIRFEANGEPYVIPVPDSAVKFSPGTGTAEAVFDKGTWKVFAEPCCSSGGTFLGGVAFTVPAGGFPGGIKNIRWTADYSSDADGAILVWKWSAAVYIRFSEDYNALGIKPVDDDKTISPRDTDNAGTPRNFKDYLTSGAKGDGGTNYTGDYSRTENISLDTQEPLIARHGGPYGGVVGEAVQFMAVGDPTWTYEWTFGDGATGEGRAVSHTYQSDGVYRVLLTVGNAQEKKASTATRAVIAPAARK